MGTPRAGDPTLVRARGGERHSGAARGTGPFRLLAGRCGRAGPRLRSDKNRGYAQSCVSITELSALVGVASPEPHHLVTAYRTLARRTKRCRRGRARPVLAEDLAAALRSPPRTAARGRGRRSLLSPDSARRARSATAGHMAVLFDAGLRYDDSREGQLGDVLFFPDGVDVSVFGSKTDQMLLGQSPARQPSMRCPPQRRPSDRRFGRTGPHGDHLAGP